MLDRRLLDWMVRRMLLRHLRGAFRRVCWVGPAPSLRAETPVVLYANHHNYYDGHLLWLVVRRLLDRTPLLWMAEWARFPFFTPAGALPFPPDDARRRSTTLRRTVRRLRDQPETALIYFPEGRLHAPEEGVLPFGEEAFARLDQLFPEKQWWPVALHVTWRGEARPTAFLTGGIPHAHASGTEPQQLRRLLDQLRTPEPSAPSQIVLEGRPDPSERWDFSFTAPFFERYL